MAIREDLNTFFVECFYSILKAEERALESISNSALTLKEIHVIEAVFKCMSEGKNNFSQVAEMLDVTLGTLTASFSKLEKKGYLMKQQAEFDKRNFYIIPTRLAEMVNEEHTRFHEKMVDGIAASLNEQDAQNMIKALKELARYFKTIGRGEQKGAHSAE